MVIGTFNIPKAKPKAIKGREGIDVATRYFAYELYETTDGERQRWGVVHEMGGSAATRRR
jgi:hypothetical protein